MATTPKGARVDEADAAATRNQQGGAVAATECALCQALLPAGHRYLCAACAAESAERAATILARLSAPASAPPAADLGHAAPEAEDPMACPTCGMPLDPSGRCAGCVTTVRR